jgi:hypothetical protein
VAGSCEYGDEPSGSGATELVTCIQDSLCTGRDSDNETTRFTSIFYVVSFLSSP